MPDQIVVRDIRRRMEVIEAPDRSEVSLALIAAAGPGLRVANSGDVIEIGDPPKVSYRITGWNPLSKTLILEKEADWREVSED